MKFTSPKYIKDNANGIIFLSDLTERTRVFCFVLLEISWLALNGNEGKGKSFVRKQGFFFFLSSLAYTFFGWYKVSEKSGFMNVQPVQLHKVPHLLNGLLL